jgi:hypothetical protein
MWRRGITREQLLYGHDILWYEMHGAVPLLLQYVFMAWCLVKHRDFTFICLKIFGVEEISLLRKDGL